MDKQELELKVFVTDTEQHILEGMLTCSHCKRYYPIIHGVPIMSPDEYREFALEAPVLKKWQAQLKGRVTENFQLLPDTDPAAL